jgi:hypothetical protein
MRKINIFVLIKNQPAAKDIIHSKIVFRWQDYNPTCRWQVTISEAKSHEQKKSRPSKQQ